MSGQNANGEGTVWLRADGRWCAAAYVPVVGGGRKRVYAYGKTRQDARRKSASCSTRRRRTSRWRPRA